MTPIKPLSEFPWFRSILAALATALATAQHGPAELRIVEVAPGQGAVLHHGRVLLVFNAAGGRLDVSGPNGDLILSVPPGGWEASCAS